jgi:cellulose synthase operon protein C
MTRFRSNCLHLFFVLTIAICPSSRAQTQDGINILLGKARSLEARGRIDLASQNWRQILLVNPNQTEALAGLARCAKENGDSEGLRVYLDRLRKINANDPAIGLIEKMHVPTLQERERLDEAGRLTLQHKADEAMRIYHEILGDEPPPGKWAGPFYEAEAASSGGHDKALAQLRRLCNREPNNEMSRLWLALVLTYDPKTRMEGFHLLESIRDPGAVEQARGPWKQALLWEKENPAALAAVEAYLQRYPDSELQSIQVTLHDKHEKAVVDADKEHAFQALQHKDIGTAQLKFEEVLRRSPNDLNATIGLGFVRLNQKRFNEALVFFDRARAAAPQRADVREGYQTAKFWLAMQRGSAELSQNQPSAAIAAYQEALALRPQDDTAMLAMAQAMVRAKRYEDAEAEFNQVLSRSSNNVDVLAGLGFIRLNQGRFDEAQKLLGDALKLSPGRKDIDEGYRNAKYWGVTKQGAEALRQNHTADAIADYRRALEIHPGAADALMGLAQATEHSGNYTEAAKAYTQLTAVNPSEVRGWLWLMRAQINAKDAASALASAQRIPASTRQELEKRSDFLSAMALAYYSAHQQSEGDQALQRALNAAGSSDTEDALNLRLQVASILMDQGNAQRAAEVYKHAAHLHPDNAIAWQGLVGAYARLGEFDAAMTTLRAMPEASYAAAANNTSFLNSVAAVYSAAGHCGKAEDLLSRSLSLDQAAGRQPPESTKLQLADIWMREGNYEKARQAYRAVLDGDPKSIEAWRNYITVLHHQRSDRMLVDETKRIPPQVYGQLAKEADFLILLASAQRTMGNNEEVIRLLEQARQHPGKAPAAELDVQLAWAMVDSSQHDQDLRNLLTTTRHRAGLTPSQLKTVDEIWSVWSVRRAAEAMANNQPDRSIAILLDAQQVLPQDRRIKSALGATYLRLHDYRKALAVYASWGMAGAEAGDYRAAAGAALAIHNNVLADAYFKEGLEHWPADPDLLQMAAKQEVSEGKYKEAERNLKTALAAARTGPAKGHPNASPSEQAHSQMEASQLRSLDGNDAATRLASSAAPACLPASSDARPRNSRVRLVNAAYVQTVDPPAQQAHSANSQQTADPEKQQHIQDEIDVVSNRNTPTVGFGDAGTGRSGDPGFDRLIIEDAAVADSYTIANRVRFAVEAHGVYLLSGTPDGTSGLQFGSLPRGATFGEQTAAGYAGMVQLSTNTFGLAFGTSPQGFPTHNLTGGLRFRPLDGPVTFMLVRDSVRDSLLSYAGAGDPATGTVWGGVVSNTGSVQLSRNKRTNGQYVVASYGFIQGTNVPDNWNVTASAGTYWRVISGLTLGVNVTGMHYDRNLSFFSLGQGGYFSPQKYYVASIPVSWFARHRRFEYEIKAALGAQYLSNDSSPFFPTEPQLGPGLFYNGSVHTGPNYNFALRMGYRVAPHWYLDTFASANNAQNFATQTVGFTLKYLIRRLPTNTDFHAKSIPDWTGKQPFGIE